MGLQLQPVIEPWEFVSNEEPWELSTLGWCHVPSIAILYRVTLFSVTCNCNGILFFQTTATVTELLFCNSDRKRIGEDTTTFQNSAVKFSHLRISTGSPFFETKQGHGNFQLSPMLSGFIAKRRRRTTSFRLAFRQRDAFQEFFPMSKRLTPISPV